MRFSDEQVQAEDIEFELDWGPEDGAVTYMHYGECGHTWTDSEKESECPECGPSRQGVGDPLVNDDAPKIGVL